MDWPTISVALATIVLSAAAWGTVARRVRSGQPVVAFAARRPVPWRFSDLLMVAAFYFLANAAFIAIRSFVVTWAGDEGGKLVRTAAETTTAGELAIGMVAGIAANLAATGFAVLWIFSHTDATWSDLGWRRDTVGQDVWLGLSAFAAIAAPIYGLQVLLSRLGSNNPIVEVLLREGTPLLYVLTGLSAVAVAPLAEEFFFRMLLQGWLESASAEAESPQPETEQPATNARGNIAILFSSLVFSLMHLGHGTDPIPLFFLALTLGYLYQQTHRLLPCVTVHFCLNACSYLMLCFS